MEGESQRRDGQGPDAASDERPWVGRPLRRVEDARHLTGSAAFVDDIERRDMLYAVLVHSPHAAARIASIDTSAAARVAGVEAVLTAADLDGVRPLFPVLERPEFVAVEMPILAAERVRHLGEAVAVVLGASQYAAEDGAEAVEVSYEEEQPVASIDAALAKGAPFVHERLDRNVLLDVQFADDPELDDVLDSAELVVEATFSSARLAAVPLEARACLADWDAREGRLVLFTSTQVPHLVRTTVSDLLDLPEQRLRVVAPDVGGGFGQKCVVSREEVLVAALARRLRRPVKWIEDRQENLVAAPHGHEQRYEIRAGFDGEGRLLGIDADICCDVGAYSTHPFTCGVEPLMAAAELPGPYRFGHYRARARAIATNKSPMAPYRGVSRPQLVLVMERLMQKAAGRLGLDPVEIRRRNLVKDDEFPYTGASSLELDRGSYIAALEMCAEKIGWDAWRERQRAARADGRLIGLGFACFAERTGYGTEAFNQRKMAVTPGYDNAHVRMDASAGVTVLVGTSGHGQGHLTTLAQIAADELGVHPDAIEVRQGDTDSVPYGWGTFASRSVVVGGGATKLAAAALRGRILRIAAHLLEAAEGDVELLPGAIRVRGSPDVSVPLADVARIAHHDARRLPDGERPHLEASASYDPPGTFSNATHGVEVEIDAETGAVAIRRYVVAEDCGVMVNPMIVSGQVRGGIAQGIAAALYEQLVYTDDGQLQTATLMDYLVPTATEIPAVEIHHLETPSAFSETGAKGVGEGGTMGAPAAVANAVSDALAHLDFEADELPITPHALRAAIRGAGERLHAVVGETGNEERTT